MVLCQDEAGPYQTKPYPGGSWQEAGQAKKYDHEYIRNGTAKIMTLLRPKTGEICLKGTQSTANAILHPWIKQAIEDCCQQLPKISRRDAKRLKSKAWQHFGEAFWSRESFDKLPTPRILLVWDNLTGHKSYELVKWLFEQGVIPLYTPLGSSWLNMAESIQSILKRRALAGSHPKTSQEIIDAFENAARVWNRRPTPFVWKGKRHQRRRRAWERHRVAASAAQVPPYRGAPYWLPPLADNHVK